MKAFGRTLWKVADALLSRKRSKDACGGGGGGGVQAVVAAVNEEKEKVVQGIMTGRLCSQYRGAIWEPLSNSRCI